MRDHSTLGSLKALGIRPVIILFSLAVFLILFDGTSCPGQARPITIVDDGDHVVQLNAPPQRVVSLVPSVTQMIADIGAVDALVGITYHDIQPAALSRKTIVGGFFAPSIDIIEALQPDVIFYTGLHHQVYAHFNNRQVAMIRCDPRSVEHGFTTLRKIGLIFNRITEASAIISRNREELDVIRRKIDTLPEGQRKRVMRIMGRNRVMTPGADSFQNDMIRLAGGIPPDFVDRGQVVPVEPSDWSTFNPQILYGCGGDRQLLKRAFVQPEWQDVEAIQESRIFFFPCDLTCRVSTQTGYFTSWLAARIYAEAFAEPVHQVYPNATLTSKTVSVQLANVESVRVVKSRIRDFTHKTLIVTLEEPISVVSTLEGPQQDIEIVGNHYLPPPSWYIDHGAGVGALKEQVCGVLNLKKTTTSFLFTGADMDHMAISQTSHRQMVVTALVTAGVETNAVCMSKDTGDYYEPGTINILLHTNMQLSPRAMTRAIISATEAKTAALAELDIRSAYPPHYEATGTGTDNIIVIPSPGTHIENAGGHSKMGELIARSVHQAVMEAVAKQNGLTSHRSIFKRLAERGITLDAVTMLGECPCLEKDDSQMGQALEYLLLKPRYAGFIQSALALSDAYEKDLIKDLTGFDQYCQMIAEEIAGRKIPEWRTCLNKDQQLPVPLSKALEALLNGSIGQSAALSMPTGRTELDNRD